MTLGIVGCEAAKFDAIGEANAKGLIRELISKYKATCISSGACHLGGVDKWAEEIAKELGIETKIFLPASHSWPDYKARNIQIAKASTIVVCISVDKLPPSYKGMTFPRCYHCNVDSHIKSGGCWTTKYARSLNKIGKTLLVKNS